MLARALGGKLVVPNWKTFVRIVKEVYQSVLNDVPHWQGHNATYIPELDEVDPSIFAVSVVTCDGQIVSDRKAS